MNLVDQYLKDVRRFLSGSSRDDIVNELREDIRSQIDDRETELGRPLAEVEVREILARLGVPAVVASRYCEGHGLAFGRQLIGPILFPFYLKVLAFNVGITLVVCSAVVAVRASQGHVVAWFSTLSAIALQLLLQSAIVTAIFTAADRGLAKRSDWRPRETRRASGGDETADRIPRLESFAQLVAGLIFLAWLPVLRRFSSSMFGSDAGAITLAPVWSLVYQAFVWMTLVANIQAILNLLRPDWVRVRSAVRAASSVAWLVVTYLVLTADRWIVVAGNVVLTDKQRASLHLIGEIFFYTMLGMALVSAITALADLRRLFGGTRRGTRGTEAHAG